MNPPAIDIYAENGIDLYTEPLEIAVCAQHHNGGFAVNKWWESQHRRTRSSSARWPAPTA